LKVWGFALLYMFTTTNTYAIAYFLPIILRDGMGFSVAKAQCLVAPPYVAAALVMYVQAIYADKRHVRGPIIVFNSLMGMNYLSSLGTSLTCIRCPRPRPPWLSQKSSRTVFRCLPRHNCLYVSNIVERIERVAYTSTGNANCPALLTYQSNNIRGQWKRALTSATLVGGGSIGGIIGTTVFRAKDAPNYRPGILVTLVANAFIVLIVAALTLKFRRANRRADSGGKPIEALVGFRYTY